MRNKTILILCIALLTGCEKITDINQQILFQVEYMNAAWGPQHHVRLVDSSGIVTSYDLPVIWNHPNSNGYISLFKMNENIVQTGEIDCTINKNILKKYFNKLDEAEKGDISDPEHRMYDAGITIYSGFLYDSHKEMYKQVFIRQVGDMYIENESNDANDIYNWMITICDKK
ncbi:MAG: hypothetical protein MUO72_19000 [Bacteroidales bacterium]|nr:hypothetical protein [Bacteroidales bacterium]